MELIDDAGNRLPLIRQRAPYTNPRFSPDGRRLAIVSGEVEGQQILVHDLQREVLARLNTGMRQSMAPVWSPDSRYMAFSDGSTLYWMRADGGSAPHRLLTGERIVPSSISPDGRWLAFSQRHVGDATRSDTDIWTVALDMTDPERPRAGKPEPFVQTPAMEMEAAFSPGGHWLAYASSESGTQETYVRPFPGAGDQWQVSSGGGHLPMWSRSGNQLLYQIPEPDSHVMVAPLGAGEIRSALERLLPRLQPAPAGPAAAIVGSSPAMRALREQVVQLAPTRTHVLVTGETGTGKELIAQSLHELSPRRGRPLVAVNCGALPAGLIESELFGHERGAFTGATQSRPGRVRQSSGGTLFLDEIGEMDLRAQVTLLRLLETREVQPLGGERPHALDLRVVAATNQNLAERVRHRARVCPIVIRHQRPAQLRVDAQGAEEVPRGADGTHPLGHNARPVAWPPVCVIVGRNSSNAASDVSSRRQSTKLAGATQRRRQSS